MGFPKSSLAESERSWGRDVRLLVVDDEEFIRAIIRERMEIEGFSVDEAQNGRQALAKLGTGDYSVLLTDIRMPEMDGITLLREASHRFPDTAWIVMTAYAELETAVAAMKHGAFDYILKPFSFDVLFVTIRGALRKALEAKDFYTRGHSQRVTLYSVAIGKKMGLPPDRLGDLRRGALLSDLGKIG